MYGVVILMLIVAFLLILMGFILLSLGGEREIRGGGVLIIGPLPIIFGTDQRVAKGLIILALILTIVTFMIFVMGWLR
ncbi:DUF131 domain-containing protein [Candidatus Korarchaeum cryptofilum]|jgi:uncharacterized membrane protein|uniref:DUF131 domain-containing protein n=1 Tax=Candidatus Korarchaeum cryptofilum TaxID=498846 RepID=A0A429G0U8_9CREN|nr:DUF131 domain-containing protein [Candidatus Korarchaeum cryptofilum]RSN67460.1 DUF131 domain-containing protein [Candidatus Korarchaeum cryptofilum]